MPRVLLAPAVAVAVEKLVEALPEGGGVQLGGTGGHALGVALGERINAAASSLRASFALARASARLTTRAEPSPMTRSRLSIWNRNSHALVTTPLRPVGAAVSIKPPPS